jgi:hypothetical protein
VIDQFSSVRKNHPSSRQYNPENNTFQATSRRRVLVFVDEINAYLEGAHVFSSFLAPLEEGYYARRGRQFILQPCIWMFAGTSKDSDDGDRADKASDFQSRMSMIEKIDFQSLVERYSDHTERIKDQARLEQVYLGASLIRNYFSDVSAISFDVLNEFYKLEPLEQPSRTIRKWATALSNVQHGLVTSANCQNWGERSWDRNKEIVRLEY